LQNPISTLPHTEFPHGAMSWDPNDPTHIMSTHNSACVFPPPPPPRVFSPRLTRDYQNEIEDDVAITNQVSLVTIKISVETSKKIHIVHSVFINI
jgi:hypothetical protein